MVIVPNKIVARLVDLNTKATLSYNLLNDVYAEMFTIEAILGALEAELQGVNTKLDILNTSIGDTSALGIDVANMLYNIPNNAGA